MKIIFTAFVWIIAFAIYFIYAALVGSISEITEVENMALITGAGSVSRLIYIASYKLHHKDDVRVWKVLSLGSAVVLIPVLITRLLNLNEYINPVALLFYVVAIFAGVKYSKFLEKRYRPVSEKPRVKLKL